MSLASAGDLSNVHMCFNDLLDSMTGSTGAEDKPGKDGVIFQFAKAMRKDHGKQVKDYGKVYFDQSTVYTLTHIILRGLLHLESYILGYLCTFCI